jgi:hypothetical protein
LADKIILPVNILWAETKSMSTMYKCDICGRIEADDSKIAGFCIYGSGLLRHKDIPRNFTICDHCLSKIFPGMSELFYVTFGKRLNSEA